MKTNEEKLEVMRGWLEGKAIQFKTLDEVCWEDVDNPIWYWEKYDYRLKPKPAPKRRVPLGPDDLPAVCWVQGPCLTHSLVVQVYHYEFWVGIGAKHTWDQAMRLGLEYSPDRKTWKPMWKEEDYD